MSLEFRFKYMDTEPIIREKHSEKMPVSVTTGDESKTQQHLKDSCDINKIVNNLDASSSAMHVQQARERYGDFSDVLDVAGNMQKALNAQYLFDSLPTALKKEVGQTVEGLFKFIGDPANKDKCIQYGLFDKPVEEVIPKVQVVNQATPGSKKDGSMRKTKVLQESSDREE